MSNGCFINSCSSNSGRVTRVSSLTSRRLAFRRRRLVLAGWVGALIAVLALGNALRGEWSVDYATPGSESKAAVDLLADRFPERGPDSVDVVWQARNAEAPAIQARVDAFIRRASRLDGIGDPVPASRADVSRDGTIAIARIPLTVSPGAVPLETGRELIDMAAAGSRDGLRLELGGQAIGNAQRGAISSETIGFAIAALVLLMTFGSSSPPACRSPPRCSASASPAALVGAAGRGRRHARLGRVGRRDDRDRRRHRLRPADPHPLPHRTGARARRPRRDGRGDDAPPGAACSSPGAPS